MHDEDETGVFQASSIMGAMHSASVRALFIDDHGNVGMNQYLANLASKKYPIESAAAM